MTTQPDPVLVLVDHDHGGVAPSAWEILAVARHLGPVHAVLVGAGPEGALEELAAYGVAAAHLVEAPADVALLAPTVARSLTRVAASADATTVVLAASPRNAEIAALAARELGAGLLLDARSLGRGADGRLVTEQLAFASMWSVVAESLAERCVVTLRPEPSHVLAHDARTEPSIRRHRLPEGDELRGLRLSSRTSSIAAEGPKLSSARVVVAGGRGTGGDFGPLRELAAALGGAVGSTRVATDEGWIAADTQIGQTGATVSPALYVGAGVSGAVHHRGGMQSAGVVVAINNDPDAPIFEIADFGVVGDLFEVVPQLTAEVLRRRS
ncbi:MULTISPECIES: electron transfer flavoprotein subunit alpha/FixB family protein [Cellulomonas]|uniref:Electron transfer flavoprotein subunit alpha n=1 Tax=Cellulomonas biazotea TaxID=1709 RepID=A0A402DM28_9CELL|nr:MULTISPECIES: electron transfer flavoprotein subunit alpha/FixB family protein [Cellulomonas]GCE75138.1 electron transfer flavoprotein subunit alpha [Cellulomonas biazotea]